MKRIIITVSLIILTLVNYAQPAIYKSIEVQDSGIFRNKKLATNSLSHISPYLGFFSQGYDSINNVSRQTGFKIYNQAFRAGALGKSNLVFQSTVTNAIPATFLQDGSVYLNNGLRFELNGANYSRIFSLYPVIYGSVANTGSIPQHKWYNYIGSGLTNTLVEFNLGASYSQDYYNSRSAFEIIGDGEKNVLQVKGNGSIGIGTSNPDNHAALHFENTGKGIIPPRLTTDQRNGINQFIEQFSIDNAGTTPYQLPPTVSIPPSPMGGIQAVAHVVLNNSGFIVDVVVDDPGTGYNAPVPITLINSTVPGFTGGAGGAISAIVNSDGIPNGLTIYNTDIDCYEYYSATVGDWVSLCSGAGTSGVTIDEVRQEITDSTKELLTDATINQNISGNTVTHSVNWQNVRDSMGIASGTYIPVLVIDANISGADAARALYSKNGNIVTVHGLIECTTGLISNGVGEFHIDLPFASSPTSTYLIGIANYVNSTNQYPININVSGETVTFSMETKTDNEFGIIYYSYQYEIL